MSTKINAVNLNISFKLIDESTNTLQAKLLRHALDELAAAGVDVAVVRATPSSIPRIPVSNAAMGPNEAELLTHTGKTRMRCPVGQDRETFAAMVLKEKFGVVVDNAAPVVDTTESSESDDEVW